MKKNGDVIFVNIDILNRIGKRAISAFGQSFVLCKIFIVSAFVSLSVKSNFKTESSL